MEARGALTCVNPFQSWRTPALDVYFVKTSLLGTHAFFMICVPMPFWFGHGDLGRGYVLVPPCLSSPCRA